MAGNVYSLRSVEDEASEWIARIEQGCSHEQRKRLEAWLAVDAKHRSVFEEMSWHWQRVSATAQVAARLNGPREATSHKRWKWVGAAAAAVLAVLCGVLFVARQWVAAPSQVYVTQTGAQRSIVLADGSSVDLNTATRIEVEYTEQQRVIRLVAGEALFKAAHEARRPFMVVAGSSVVRAVGTAFVVRVAADRTNVVVTEGRVSVSSTAKDSSPPALLSAGEQVSISTAMGAVAKIEAQEIDRSLAWRRGVLNIQDQSLIEVIAEVQRYGTTRFEIADPALSDIKVGGYFKATDIDAFVTLLEGQFPVRAERSNPDLIVLHRRQ